MQFLRSEIDECKNSMTDDTCTNRNTSCWKVFKDKIVCFVIEENNINEFTHINDKTQDTTVMPSYPMISESNISKFTPLHFAAINGYKNVVKWLLEESPKKAKNPEDENLVTPFQLALKRKEMCEGEKKEVFQQIVELFSNGAIVIPEIDFDIQKYSTWQERSLDKF